MNWLLLRWLASAQWRAQRVRTVVSVAAIAVGVALGLAVHLVNNSALSEFSGAIKKVTGHADLVVQGASGQDFDELLYPLVANTAGVAHTSPIVEATVPIAGLPDGLRVYGIDVFRAVQISPALLPMPANATQSEPRLQSNALFLSDGALEAAHLSVGQSLTLNPASGPLVVPVVGRVPGAGMESLGVMDIADAQWHFGQLGRISRLELTVAPDTSVEDVRARLAAMLPQNLQIATPADENARADSLSRAYRVNLDMLALMALLTGAFLVYSTQSLAVARRTRESALLRVMGLSRRALVAELVFEGALLGAIGSALGIILGVALAWALLRALGGDFGGGYFRGMHPVFQFSYGAAMVFWLLGCAAAVAGSWLPARAAGRILAAQALKAGGELTDPRVRPRWQTPAVLLLAAAILAILPPLFGLPILGYLAMACLLFSGITAMPAIARVLLAPLRNVRARATLSLALQRLWGAPDQATVALCGIVASVSLIVSMAVMVTSFRESVASWLDQVLVAPLYLRINGPADTLQIEPALQAQLALTPGIARAQFQKMLPLRLDPARPAVTLIVKEYDPDPDAESGRFHVLVQRATTLPTDAIPVWVSEAMQDLYGLHVGSTLRLPLSSPDGRVVQASVAVAGVWRDYARQHGAIIMRNADYTRITGDAARTDAAFWLKAGVDSEAVRQALRAQLPSVLLPHLEMTDSVTIRTLSLKIFDRSFAVTYLLEAIAILMGIVGVATTFSAQTIARAKEFGMLRHIGVTRSQVLGMLGWEGLLLGVLGAIAGLCVGLLMSAVLIQVVNPQSFHWTMDTHVPWRELAWVGTALLGASACTAIFAGRHALSGSTILAVREDD